MRLTTTSAGPHRYALGPAIRNVRRHMIIFPSETHSNEIRIDADSFVKALGSFVQSKQISMILDYTKPFYGRLESEKASFRISKGSRFFFSIQMKWRKGDDQNSVWVTSQINSNFSTRLLVSTFSMGLASLGIAILVYSQSFKGALAGLAVISLIWHLWASYKRDFLMSKMALEKLLRNLSAMGAPLAPNQPMHSDGAATAAPPVMAGR